MGTQLTIAAAAAAAQLEALSPMVPNNKQTLIALAKKIAANFKLAPELVCALIEQESGWNCWSMRYEPEFFAKYVSSLYTNNQISATEAYARGMSWGLCQVMGEVARENGFDMRFLSALCDPETGISMGCTILAKKLEREGGDVVKGLLAYNGGGNKQYAVQVLARQDKYR